MNKLVKLIQHSRLGCFLGGVRMFYFHYLKNYRKLMGFCHPSAVTSRPLKIFGAHNIYLYENTKISDATILATDAKFILGKNSATASGLLVITGNHERRIGTPYRCIHDLVKKEGLDKDVIVEEDCWIGARVTLLMGVTVRRGTTIASGAVVNKSTAPYSIVGGVPAKHIKFYWTIDQILEHESKVYPENERYSRIQLEDYFSKYTK